MALSRWQRLAEAGTDCGVKTPVRDLDPIRVKEIGHGQSRVVNNGPVGAGRAGAY